MDEPAVRRTHVATATRAVLSTFIGTHHPTRWLVECPISLQNRLQDRYFGSIYVWNTRMPNSLGSPLPGLKVWLTSITRSTMSEEPSCAAVNGNVFSVGPLASAGNCATG